MCKIVSAFLAFWTGLSLFCVPSFKVSDYDQRAKEFPNDLILSDFVLGEIETACEARKKAETVWVEAFGETVLQQKPYHVRYDKRNDAWLVYGTLRSPFPGLIGRLFMRGGVAHIIMKKSDGKVLAVWHEE